MGQAGKRAKLYYDSAWTTGSDIGTPTWVEILLAVDLTFNSTKGEADISSRESGDVLRTGALGDKSINFGYRIKKGADTVYDKLLDSHQNGTPVLFAIVDGDIAPGAGEVVKGWQMVGEVMELTEEYPHANGMIANGTIAQTAGRESTGGLIQATRLEITGGP